MRVARWERRFGFGVAQGATKLGRCRCGMVRSGSGEGGPGNAPRNMR